VAQALERVTSVSFDTMRSLSGRASLATLLLVASCERIAGLDDKLFAPPSEPTIGEGGSAATGGTSSQGGASGEGRAGSLGGGARGGSDAGGAADPRGGDGGDAGNAGSDDGGDGGFGGRECVDAAAELCMQTTWPGGIVPYVIESDSELVAGSLRRALLSWEGKPIGSTVLDFVEKAVPDVRTLVVTLEKGCRPTSITDDAIEVAMGDCPGTLAMSHAIGVTLGLPSMHRRGDRDRYLEMREPTAFSCEEGTFFEKCPDRGDIRAVLGPFDFSSEMFEPSATLASCEFEPDAARLYVARGVFTAGADACRWATGNLSVTASSAAGALAELYAISAGWRPFELAGLDVAEDQPLASCLGETAYFRSTPRLVATENGGLAAFALGGDPIELWLNENDGESWGAWARLPPAPDLADYAHGFAAAPREVGASLVDVVVMDVNEVFHLSYDRVQRRAEGWTSLGSPRGEGLSGLAVAPGGSGRVFVYTYAYPTGTDVWDGQVYVREFDGQVWTDWQPLPPFGTRPQYSSVPSLAAVLLDGEQHLVAAASDGLHYAFRSNGTWSDWHIVTTPDPERTDEAPHTIALVSNDHYRLGVLGISGGGNLWFSGCDTPSCVDAAAWSKPFTIGETGGVSAAASTPDRIDVAAVMWPSRPPTQTAPCTDGMWHKRWQAPQ
jgi:hypothetical protein